MVILEQNCVLSPFKSFLVLQTVYETILYVVCVFLCPLLQAGYTAWFGLYGTQPRGCV